MQPHEQNGEPDAPPRDRRHVWFAALGLIALFTAIAWQARSPSVVTGNDDASYILASRALLDGTYRDLHRVDAGWHSQYPPAYPALLAVTAAIVGEGFGVFIALNIALAAAALLLTFDATRRLWSNELAVAVLASGVTAASFLEFSTSAVMAEAAYTAFCALALWVLATRPASAPWLLAAGLAACLAALTRSAGVALVGSHFLFLSIRRRWRAATTFAAGAALTVGPWLAWIFLAPNQYAGRSYAADIVVGAETSFAATLVERISTNAVSYATRSLPSLLSLPTLQGTVLDNLFWIGLIATFGSVGLLALWKRWPALALYLVSYGALLLVWPWNQARFLVPVIPFAILALLLGASVVGARFAERWRRLPVYGLAAVLVISGLAAEAQLIGRRSGCDRSANPPTLGCQPPEQQAFVDAARYARDSLDATSAVVVWKDASFAYHSGLKVIPASLFIGLPPAVVLERVRETGADLASVGLVHPADARLANTLRPLCDDLSVVGTFEPDSYLLGFAGGAAHNPADACAALDRVIASADPSRLEGRPGS